MSCHEGIFRGIKRNYTDEACRSLSLSVSRAIDMAVDRALSLFTCRSQSDQMLRLQNPAQCDTSLPVFVAIKYGYIPSKCFSDLT